MTLTIKIILVYNESFKFRTGVNKLAFPPVLAGEKLLKISCSGRIVNDYNLPKKTMAKNASQRDDDTQVVL